MTRDTPRQTKTPAQRAQEAVDVLERRLVKQRAKHSELVDEAAGVAAEASETETRLAYARQNPDLPSQPATGTTHTEESA